MENDQELRKLIQEELGPALARLASLEAQMGVLLGFARVFRALLPVSVVVLGASGILPEEARERVLQAIAAVFGGE